eukprot:2846038-Pyramimonas_sp.AAC.1
MRATAIQAQRIPSSRVQPTKSAGDLGPLIRPRRGDFGAALAGIQELRIPALAHNIGPALETNDGGPVTFGLMATGPVKGDLLLHRRTIKGGGKRLRVDANLVGRLHRERDGGRRRGA